MTSEEKKEKLLAMISEMADDLKGVVEEIENNSMQVTQHNYDRYMTVIHELSNGNKTQAMLVVMALLDAGANREGVKNAMRVCYPS